MREQAQGGIDVEQFWNEARRIMASGEPAVLATVMAVNRQVPRVSPPGTCLIVTATGTVGGLDGGAVDSLVVPFLQTTLSVAASLQTMVIPAEVAHRHGMLHGGTVELLVQPLSDFAPETLEEISSTLSSGERAVLVTPLRRHGDADRPGKPALVRQGVLIGDVEEAVLEAALEAVATAGRPAYWESAGSRAFINVVHPPERLVILGTTLVAEVLCELAGRAGFRVTLVDDTGCASPERYRSAAAIVRNDDPVEALLATDLTPATFVVLMSVAHRLDMPAVQRLRCHPLRYLGMMGNRGRVAKCFTALAADGFTTDDLARLHAPIGLNVGAESPFEIAVAILAQLIQVRRSHTGPVSDWTVAAPHVAG
jgi:xanthine dehydrogenase accessory factor